MKRSEIFDSFVKIAQERGMMSKDYHDSKKKLEQTGRADSLDISAIEALYGTKPDASKGMDYKSNIMEAAHPNSVVVSPSYDKLNGLVENNIERQNIILNILNHTPTGLLTQKKYAEKELLLSLVRIGNDLDNRGNEDLCKLSDFCLLQAKQSSGKGFQKTALAPLAIVAIVAAVVGALYAHQHLPNLDKGLDTNYKKLSAELDDFLTDNTNWGVGHEYDEELKSDVVKFKGYLDQFMAAYAKYSGIIRELERPKDAKELMGVINHPKTDAVVRAIQELRELAGNMEAYMDQTSINFSSNLYKNRHTKDKGLLTSVVENAHLVGGTTSLLADNFQDVINAIPPFRSSISDLVKMLEASKNIQNKAQNDLASSLTKSQAELGGSESPAAPASTEASNGKNKTVEDIDKESDELSQALKSFPGLA